MVEKPTADDLITLLRNALDAADSLGMSRIACHIDHALALALETAAIGQPAPPPGSSSVM